MPVVPLYVDPTAAGLGLQMLLGAIVGGLVAIRLFWGRVFSLFRRTRREAEGTLATSEEAREAVEEDA
ncbi:MAG: hypothetical protein GTO63_36315 [Anaerolineae bacterium]|nr:hypothetical protein [Anaerolineae bacterium]NIO00219.1 hypothetical protein [Anaerolineae bacterium]NIQ83000.1 hypothetical protein [Anaerolineae bacterium]